MDLKYIVDKKDVNKNINEIIALNFNLSNRLNSKLIKNHLILLNGSICDTRMFPNVNDVITINLNIEEDNSNIIPSKMNLNIIYEDEWILVVNKPSGIPIHPSRMHFSDSLSNGVKSYFDAIGLHKKIRPVNRLDIDTSGLVIFAKCEYIQECFIKQMLDNTFQKFYLCFVERFFRK